MKKLLSTLLLSILIISNAQVALGASIRDVRNQCEIEQGCDEKETRSERRACRNQCKDQAEASAAEIETVEGKIGEQGEVKKTILPPIEKPAFVPGPKLTEGTGEEINRYVTKKFLPAIAKRLTTIVAVLALLGLVFSGLLFFTAAGVSEKVDKAKKAAIYSIVGLIISLLSFTIVQIVNLLPLG